jgi:hypothetical protein
VTLANAATTLAAAATTLATAATALFSSDAAWALNANGTKRTPSARSVAKHRQVMPAVVSMTVVEMRYVLLTGFQLQPISEANKLPTACNRKEAARKKE